MRHFVGAACGLWVACALPAQAEPVVVVELFTSQGCSSCPPADAFLQTLTGDPRIIPLSLHVDYWDYIGWADSFASPEFTKRQKAYARAAGAKMIYTPQMIVNGIGHAIGSDRTAVERVMEQTRGQSGVLAVPVSVRMTGDTITVTLPQATVGLSPEAPATVFLFGVSSRQPVEITRGENRGQTVTYRNVVRSHANLGEWTGAARTFTVSRRDLVSPECERLAVLVQAGTPRRPGAVVGAAMVDIPPLLVH